MVPGLGAVAVPPGAGFAGAAAVAAPLPAAAAPSLFLFPHAASKPPKPKAAMQQIVLWKSGRQELLIMCLIVKMICRNSAWPAALGAKPVHLIGSIWALG